MDKEEGLHQSGKGCGSRGLELEQGHRRDVIVIKGIQFPHLLGELDVGLPLGPRRGIEPPVKPSEGDRDDGDEEEKLEQEKPTRLEMAKQEQVQEHKLKNATQEEQYAQEINDPSGAFPHNDPDLRDKDQ